MGTIVDTSKLDQAPAILNRLTSTMPTANKPQINKHYFGPGLEEEAAVIPSASVDPTSVRKQIIRLGAGPQWCG